MVKSMAMALKRLVVNEPPNDFAVKVEKLALLLIMLIRPSVFFRHEEGVLAGDSVEQVGHKTAYHNIRIASLAASGWNKQICVAKTRQENAKLHARSIVRRLSMKITEE